MLESASSHVQSQTGSKCVLPIQYVIGAVSFLISFYLFLKSSELIYLTVFLLLLYFYVKAVSAARTTYGMLPALPRQPQLCGTGGTTAENVRLSIAYAVTVQAEKTLDRIP